MKKISEEKIIISVAVRKELGSCLEILMDSILGEKYFSREIAGPILSQALARKELFVARSASGEVLGFYRLVLDGVFLVFAYIHLIAVKSGSRGRGIGTKLLEDAERRILEERDYPDIKKSFLLVGKSNGRAKRYYERRGYARVATLTELFAPGDTEFLMVKQL